MVPDEEFTSLKLKKKLRRSKNKIVSSSEIFKANVLGTEISVSGEDVRVFVRSYEQKLGQYVDNPFLTVLTDGALLRGVKNFQKYVLGTAICKHYGLPPKRFIEVQFYYHDEWKGCPPSLLYITSLTSEWNSVGRYKQYCTTYKNEIDYFDEGGDNVDAAYRSQTKPLVSSAPKASLVRIYEEMITFQMEATGKSRKDSAYLEIPSTVDFLLDI